MSKKNKEFIKYRDLFLNKDSDDTANMVKDLESAWNNLPDDIYQDERAFFIELIEKVAKMHSKLKKTDYSEDLTKN